ncbi:MAG: hypothetical protein H7Y01_11175 [Ferruginibacter sp.]|nr:hypothetical protein [Chitinophagaceae bacterium]
MAEIGADKIKLLHAEAAALFHQKHADEEIVSYIISKGYERHYAETVLDNVKEDTADKKSFWKTLFYGIGFLLAGLFVTSASRYFALSAGAMFYVFFWGLVVAGTSIIVRAFIIFRK